MTEKYDICTSLLIRKKWKLLWHRGAGRRIGGRPTADQDPDVHKGVRQVRGRQWKDGTLEDEYSTTVFDNIIFALESILQLIIRSSYIGTNIIMMFYLCNYL
ncbi:hypothetical protein NQ315_003649 [Exocentrus adspersus]|uniref:Uncharacterized protein n=1 Tax=Exocentrus adspersus TaxID=1586481 RepID=A0AAV8VCB2_9CUCU|nr:hypothetical protein NQ315_003649 [Exocentrus adspersus]